MRRLLTVATALTLNMTAAMAGDPAGTYRVEGTNPGGGSGYSGTVTVERTGDSYRVTWVIGGQRFVGTGIGNKNSIAVSYRSSNQTGLAVYSEDGSDWTGVWTVTDGRQLGREVWKRR